MRIDSLYVVIDRIDRIFEGGDADDRIQARKFVVKLLRLAQKAPETVRFIMTSIEEPSNYIDDDDAFTVVQDSHIDTGRRPGQRKD